jgi:hypothetical protein
MIGRTHGYGLLVIGLLATGATAALHAQTPQPLVVTSTNALPNQLLVYSSEGALLQTLSTHGNGGASGNAGGIETKAGLVAVVNFNSQSVAVFERRENGLQFSQTVSTLSKPVSVAFSSDHLYILGLTTVESHPIHGDEVSNWADGSTTLFLADGSAAQVGVLPAELIVTEKSNVIETVGLSGGAVSGAPALVSNIPTNVNAPFGLVTRRNNAYVTIAHANEISLVRNGTVLTVTGSGTQSAPCWLTLVGPFLFSSNSPSMSVSRYAVYGEHIVQDAAVAASLNGDPTDIAYGSGLIAVIDGNGPVSHLSIFTVDEDGNLTMRIARNINAPANGVAVIDPNDQLRSVF